MTRRGPSFADARLDRQLAEEDHERATRKQRKDKHVPKTKDGIRRASLKLDALDTEVDAAYSTASEALDAVQTLRERERATENSATDQSRFPAAGRKS